jgi:hypothetical protein
MAGYSGTPLPQKLGIRPADRIALIGAPRGFAVTLGELPAGVEIVRTFQRGALLNVIVFFVTKQSQLQRRFSSLAKRLDPSGGLWVSWPKRASGVTTDVGENTVRKVALATGLVDNKVCAIDEVWSSLRCVVRLRDRTANPVKARRSSLPAQ